MIEQGANGTVWERFSLDVCTDCFFLIANGEGPEEVAEALEANWPSKDGWSLCLGAEECEDCNDDEYGCEGWFSWSSCEGCGSSLGGDRHHVTAMRRLDPLEVLAREGQALNTKQLSLI